MGKLSWSGVNRGFYIGLAIGQLWLAAISTSFVSMLWILGQNPAQVALILIGVVLVGLILLVAALFLLRSSLRLPNETSPEMVARSKSIGKKIGLLFGLVLIMEGVIIGALTGLLSQANHGDWSTPVMYFIVGLHFFPLAFIFRVRPYLVLGCLWVIITVLTVIFTPASLIVGQGTSAWVFFPIAGCGVATWPVVAYVIGTNLRRVRHVLRLPSPAL